MPRALAVLLFLSLPAAAARGDDGPPVPVIQVSVKAAEGPAPRALRYPLLPDDAELTPGNAALQWLRAGRAAVAAPALTAEQYDQWLGEKPLAVPSRDKVRKHLDSCRAALRHAELAARCERCDWETPPLTVQNFGTIDSMLVDIQALRALAALLSLQCRLQLSEADWDGAAHTLQTGLALSRHLCQGPTLIQCLVGIAIGGIMQGRVEEWMATPGSPNLYWSLAALPRPFVDIRPSLRYELATLYRSYPALRRVGKEKYTARQIEALVEEVTAGLAKLEEPDGKLPLDDKLGISVATARLYPDAKAALLAAGRKRDEVEAMPALQVVLIHLLDRYDRLGDDTLKWMGLPYWQGRSGLEEVKKELDGSLTGPGSFLIGSLTPAMLKVYDASTRLDRFFAGLRAVEALRLHAAAHDGKLPEKLSDVRAAPLPIDPATGRGFDEAYQYKDGQAVLELRAVEGRPSLQARRYQLTEAK
jgi:hypothetical protein